MSSTQDLRDPEIAELDDLLAQTPEPLQPLDVSMLDGYLCGVLVQPRLIDIDEWLPPIFDYDGAELPDDVDAAWLERITELAGRRHAALRRQLAEDGWFDPVILDFDEAAEPDPLPEDATAEDKLQRAQYLTLPPYSRAVLSWVAGFEQAVGLFGELLDLGRTDVDAALAHIHRHLPVEGEVEEHLRETLNREHPLKDLDAAIEDLVVAVVNLHDLTEKERYAVKTVRYESAKVGRNEPCPCGSGKKFKACHGAS